jgi:hypothetical protein
MLNSVFPNTFRWNRIQEPARPSGQSADLMRLLSALDSGWTIANPVTLIACEDDFGGQAFEITLYHFLTKETLELLLARQESVERFLQAENVTVRPGKSILQ